MIITNMRLILCSKIMCFKSAKVYLTVLIYECLIIKMVGLYSTAMSLTLWFNSAGL